MGKESCNMMSLEERDRIWAASLNDRANKFAFAGDFARARTVLDAAAALLDASGGRDVHAGVWLLSAEGNLLEQRKELPAAYDMLVSALSLARRVYARDDHPGVAACMINVGDLALQLGDRREAAAFLQPAVATLKDLLKRFELLTVQGGTMDHTNFSDAPLFEHFSLEYIQLGIQHAEGLLARCQELEEALPAPAPAAEANKQAS